MDIEKLESKDFEYDWQLNHFVNECYDGFIKTPVSITYNSVLNRYVLFYHSKKVED